MFLRPTTYRIAAFCVYFSVHFCPVPFAEPSLHRADQSLPRHLLRHVSSSIPSMLLTSIFKVYPVPSSSHHSVQFFLSCVPVRRCFYGCTTSPVLKGTSTVTAAVSGWSRPPPSLHLRQPSVPRCRLRHRPKHRPRRLQWMLTQWKRKTTKARPASPRGPAAGRGRGRGRRGPELD